MTSRLGRDESRLGHSELASDCRVTDCHHKLDLFQVKFLNSNQYCPSLSPQTISTFSSVQEFNDQPGAYNNQNTEIPNLWNLLAVQYHRTVNVDPSFHYYYGYHQL